MYVQFTYYNTDMHGCTGSKKSGCKYIAPFPLLPHIFKLHIRPHCGPLKKGSIKLIVTLYTQSSYSSVHNTLFRIYFKHTLKWTKYRMRNYQHPPPLQAHISLKTPAIGFFFITSLKWALINSILVV